MTLYEDDGETDIASDDDGGLNFLSRIEMELAAGTYFAKVNEANDDGEISPYTISLRTTVQVPNEVIHWELFK